LGTGDRGSHDNSLQQLLIILQLLQNVHNYYELALTGNYIVYQLNNYSSNKDDHHNLGRGSLRVNHESYWGFL